MEEDLEIYRSFVNFALRKMTGLKSYKKDPSMDIQDERLLRIEDSVVNDIETNQNIIHSGIIDDNKQHNH